MNVFILDDNVEKCAEYMVMRHLHKMPTEHTQLLWSAIHITREIGFTPKSVSPSVRKAVNTRLKSAPSNKIDPVTGVNMYLMTHENHPCAIWARKSRENFLYLCDLNDAIQSEREYRYGSKLMKSVEMSRQMRQLAIELPSRGLTPFALAVPDDVKQFNPVKSYRDCYRIHKKHIHDWSGRGTPDWI